MDEQVNKKINLQIAVKAIKRAEAIYVAIKEVYYL